MLALDFPHYCHICKKSLQIFSAINKHMIVTLNNDISY
jgi:hypothetical protein